MNVPSLILTMECLYVDLQCIKLLLQVFDLIIVRLQNSGKYRQTVNRPSTIAVLHRIAKTTNENVSDISEQYASLSQRIDYIN